MISIQVNGSAISIAFDERKPVALHFAATDTPVYELCDEARRILFYAGWPIRLSKPKEDEYGNYDCAIEVHENARQIPSMSSSLQEII